MLTGAVPTTAPQGPQAYGIDAFLQQADAITWTVLAILVLMSVLSWQVMLYRSLALWWMGWRAKKSLGIFWAKASLAAGEQALSEREQGPCSRLAAIATAATRQFEQHGSQGLARGLSQADLLTRLLAEGLAAERARLERGLTLLASVGSTAPFVGLFGTVWGIHHALVRIGVTGQATIDQVAGPVGEALIMTAIGLAVAVPAVLGYNALLRRNSLLLSKLQAFANALLVYATTGARLMPDRPLARSESAPSRVEATV
ncbi:MAG: MotA/TolQ/ExbB proton channel family protein [Gammaproteobacteria bacterium]